MNILIQKWEQQLVSYEKIVFPNHFDLFINKESKQNSLILPDARNKDEMVLN